ncbi:unnamed protein product, partial [Ectocarpus sp. 12 AP-2014]
TLRTGNLPIKLVLQDKIGSTISKATDTAEFIALLREHNISLRFNVSKTTGRVSGISFRYQDIVYKGSTLGKKFSWNSITKHIDYEQTRDRPVILSANEQERGTHHPGERNYGTTIKPVQRNYGTAKGVENSSGKSKGHLGKIEGDGVVEPLLTETEWNPFKLELKDDDLKKFKRKKKKKGFSL